MTHLEQLRRAGLFDKNVPRYTSYPPATKFHSGIGATEYTQWIGQLAPGSDISLYVHVPFCHRLCWYCACRTQGVKTLSPVSAYLEVLGKEINQLAEMLPAGVAITRMHWGGGSPTILDGPMIAGLTAALRAALPLAPDLDFSVEIDPTCVDEDKTAALLDSGLTRASIGVQDFAPEVQQAIGREQGFETTRDCIDGLRRAGIASLNVDIVYGLPLQSREGLARTVDQVISLQPDRVALFGYAHVPWMAKRQRMISEDDLPGSEMRYELFTQAAEQFQQAGLDAIGIDHFARPDDSLALAQKGGHLRRNFQGYTDDNSDALVGLGASSISCLPNGYAQNETSTSAYMKSVNAGNTPISKGFVLSLRDKIFGRAIEMLMCDFFVSTQGLGNEFGDLADIVQPVINEVADAFPDFVTSGPDGLRITEAGRPVTRILARRFDDYRSSSAQHSQAI